MSPRKKAISKPVEEVITPQSVIVAVPANKQKLAPLPEEELESSPDEPGELLTALKINNFVLANSKGPAHAFDMVSDPYSVITYHKNAKGQWAKTHGPYQSSVKNAVTKIREKLLRVRGASKDIAALTALIKEIDQDMHVTITAEFDRLRRELRNSGKLKEPVIVADEEPPVIDRSDLEQVTPRVLRTPSEPESITVTAPAPKVTREPEALNSAEFLAKKLADHKPSRKKRG